MFGLGWTEVALILIVAVIIFGPKRIPELGSTFGKTLRSFKLGMSQSSEVDEPEEDESAE